MKENNDGSISRRGMPERIILGDIPWNVGGIRSFDAMTEKANLKTTMSRVAEDKAGRYLPAKLIGAIMSKRGMSVKPTGHKVDAK